MKSFLRVLVLGVAAAVLTAGPASATWSIVVLNRRTGELGIASATCLGNFVLSKSTPVMQSDYGASVAQSTISPFPFQEMTKEGIKLGMTPHHLLNVAISQLGSEGRQYGMATFTGPPASWSGAEVGAALGNRAGVVGDIAYAVQGNLLSGEEVVFAAEKALLETPGDTSQRLMAAMQAARLLGGDGRCSCGQQNPDCGAPPPGFDPEVDKSAHVGFVKISRRDDKNKACTTIFGCANGDYYLSIEFVGGSDDPDPVVELQTLYDAWRADRIGRPDGVQSQATVQGGPLVVGGDGELMVTLALSDIDGVPIEHGGAQIEVFTKDKRGPFNQPSAAVDHGNGTYSFTMTAGEHPGTHDWRVRIDDGGGYVATLFPFLEIETLPAR